MCAIDSIVYGDLMALEAVTARLPRETIREIERLAEQLKVDRSELIRRLLAVAIQNRKIEDAQEVYREGSVTLWRAAEMAGVSLHEMMELVRAKKIPVPYTLDDLKRDVEYVKRKAGSMQ